MLHHSCSEDVLKFINYVKGHIDKKCNDTRNDYWEGYEQALNDIEDYIEKGWPQS